jgi:TPR repeat protein
MSAFDALQKLVVGNIPRYLVTVVNTDALFRIADAAEEAGNYDLARLSFERGAALGNPSCLMRLAYMDDLGGIGVAADKRRAMQLYRSAWRRGCPGAANNIAILYREKGNHRAMFQWFRREADAGDGGAHLDLAKCYLAGTGVRKNVQAALRCLATAVNCGWEDITDAEREEAQALIATLRPRAV